MKRLIEIQNELKAPKNQRNNFGGYNYRSCEDILEAVKPLLKEQNIALIIQDEIVNISDRFYVKATATLFDEDGKRLAETSALAREEESKKGQDASQITGATSSYARKYALNGLFAIDDAKDADATNTHDKTAVKPVSKPKQTQPAEQKNDTDIFCGLVTCDTVEELNDYWTFYHKKVADLENFKNLCANRKAVILGQGG